MREVEHRPDVFDDVARTAAPALLGAALKAGARLGLSSRSPSESLPTRRHRVLRDALVLAERREIATVPVPDEGIGRLAEAVETGRGLALPETAAYQRAVFQCGVGAAPELVRRFVPASARSVLDAGGGAGAYAAEVARQRAGARVVLADTPEVLAATAGWADGFCPVAHDLAGAPPEGPWDAILLVNVLHLFGHEAARALLARLAATLAPAGVLVAKEPRLEPDHTGTETAILFNLSLITYTDGDGIPDVGETTAWFEGLGLETAVHRLASSPNSVVWTGTRASMAPSRSSP